MQQKQLQTMRQPGPQRRHLEAELAEARQELAEREAALAQEQAAVNHFRMQCRLKIGKQVDTLLDLRAQKQTLLTRLELERQAQDDGVDFDNEAFFGEEDDEEDEDIGATLARGETAVSDQPPDKTAAKRLYRELARRFHPDLAHDSAERAYRTSIMAAINNAYSNRNVQALRDLAGELDPATVADLNLTDTSQEIRKLHQQVMACKRRRRKISQQLKALRQENSAKLWRRARQLEEEGQIWWEEIRLELEQAIVRVNEDVAQLQTSLIEQEKL